MGTRGVWSLENVEVKYPEDDWVDYKSVWTASNAADDAYFGGGYPTTTIVEKLTYATSGLARVPSADLTNYGGYNAARVSSGSAGYFAGGIAGNPQDRRSYTRKLTYSTETVSNLPSSSDITNDGPHGSQGKGGAFNTESGYISGGRRGGGNDESSRVDKITFSSESWASLPNLPEAVQFQGDPLGNLDAGYWCGGSPGVRTMVQKVTYSTDTTSRAPSSDLANPGRYFSAVGNAEVGFLMGRGTSPTARSTIQKFTYSTETTALNPSNVPIPVKGASGTGNLTTGYSAGGFDVSGSYLSSIHKMDLSTSTASTFGSNLHSPKGEGILAVSARNHGATGKNAAVRWYDASSPTPNKGLFGAGQNPSPTNEVCNADFTTETIDRLPGSDLPASKYSRGFCQSSTVGYWVGGGYPFYNGTDKVTFATDTATSVPGASCGQMYQQLGTETDLAGYISGGGGPGPTRDSYAESIMNKITYSTETRTALPGALDWGRGGGNPQWCMVNGTASSDGTSGWWYWGEDGGYYKSYVFKSNFSTDTMSQLTATLPESPTVAASNAGTKEFTIVMGGPGSPRRSSCQKFTYSTETFSTPSAQLSPGSQFSASQSNGDAAYYSGGETPSELSTTQKYTYSSDTIGTLPGMNYDASAIKKHQGGGVRNGHFSANVIQDNRVATPTPAKSPGPSFNGALFMGGYNRTPAGGTLSSGGKIDFSTDTPTMLPATTLGAGRYNLTATGSQTAGYYGQAQTSQIVKVTYSDATPSVLPGGLSNGPDPRRRGTSFGPKTAGYFMQGDTGSSGNLSNLDKVVYSTEVIARLPGSNAPNGAYATSGTSNQTAGYQTGGNSGGSVMRKLPFATESWGNVPTGNLTVTMWDASTFSNSTNGFWVGGSGNGRGSIVEKLVFSTDTTARLPGSNFPLDARYGWAGGNTTDGYRNGDTGSSPSSTSHIYKIPYSNDTWTTLPSSSNTDPHRGQCKAAGARDAGKGATAPNMSPNVI